jgi:SOS response regulatory protein OraA/RecX
MKALEYAIRSLLRKRQTEKEIRERIIKRHPGAPVDEVIDRLKELNYINDEQFSEAWVRHRSLTSPKGKFQLNMELKRKGVSSNNREKAIEEYDEKSVLKEIAVKKWLQLNKNQPSSPRSSGVPLKRGRGSGGGSFFQNDSERKKRDKLMRFLLSRGFAISSVLEIVKSFAQNEEN